MGGGRGVAPAVEGALGVPSIISCPKIMINYRGHRKALEGFGPLRSESLGHFIRNETIPRNRGLS